MKSEVPVVNTLQVGQVLNLQYNMDIIDETGTFYIDNHCCPLKAEIIF
jgi:hypothetical protein